jgi:hypothetical protein
LLCSSVLPHPTPPNAALPPPLPPHDPVAAVAGLLPQAVLPPLFLSGVVDAFFFLPRVVLFHHELKMRFSLPPAA